MTHHININEFIDPYELMGASIAICNHYYAELGLEPWVPDVIETHEGDRYTQPLDPALAKYQEVRWLMASGPIQIRHQLGDLLPEEYGAPRYRVSISFTYNFCGGLVDFAYEVMRDLIDWIGVHGGTGRISLEGAFGPRRTLPFARFEKSMIH